MCRSRRNVERAALVPAHIDALCLNDLADFVDSCEHRSLQRDRGVASVLLDRTHPAPGEQRRAPSAIAAGGTEATDFLFYYGDFQRGIGARKVVRGPKTRVTAPHDCDVERRVAIEGGARRQVVVTVFEPKAVGAVVLHARRLSPNRIT